MQSIPSRVQNFLLRRLTKRQDLFDAVVDQRQQGKITHELPVVITALLLGLVANRRTLRDVEAMTHSLDGPWRKLVPQTISDTTLDSVLRQLSWQQIQDESVALVRELNRSKLLKPIPGLPIRLIVVDGKNLSTLGHDADGTAQPRSRDNDKWQGVGSKAGTYWLAPVLRAALASTEARPCLLQMPLAPKTNESGSLEDFLGMLQKHYGRSDLLDVLSLDAGLTSLRNADAIAGAGLRYVLGLKDNQPELFKEARLLLEVKAKSTQPESETPWERRGSQRIKRQLWRTNELVGFENSAGTWTHLQQVWLVRQTTYCQDGSTTHEDRYFLTSLPWQELGGLQILACVRLHWVIEDDVFNALDMQWREDSGVWCTQGAAIWALGVLRMMAYNIVQCLRRRHCRNKRGRQTWYAPMPWRRLFEYIFDALRGYGVAAVTD